MGNYHITCPYCFSKFDDDQVIFRANTSYTEEQTQDPRLSQDEREVRKLFRQYDPTTKRAQDIVPSDHADRELMAYWETRGGDTGFTTADPHWMNPHI
ncbi:MAG: hypothetical protein II795_05080, partial [Firmicutes bacterium]|nr:hypothetical protein [Bacillota bacterium]